MVTIIVNTLKKSTKAINVFKLIAMLLTLYIVLSIFKNYNYLLFHTVVELLGIIPSIMIFIIVLYVWEHLAENNFLAYIGIAFFFIGVVDLTHTLSYEGMSIFKGYDANLPTQLWILARYIQVISIIIGCILINRKKRVNKEFVFSIYFIVILLAFISIFKLQNFPDSFIVGEGLTSFKIVSEYIIVLGLIISSLIIWKNKHFFNNKISKLLVFSLFFQVLSELSFTTFVSLYGYSNFLGHYFKVIWIFLFYKAIIATALDSPSKRLIKDLLKRESELNEKNIELESKIDELASSRQLLQESENQLNAALDNAPIPIMLRTESGKILKVSKEWTKITGYSIKDIPTINEWTRKAYGSESEIHKDIIKKPLLMRLILMTNFSASPRLMATKDFGI